ncbi:MAG TPA: hypothetical protein VIL74_09920 [Pyrinomonadaceae bacterium]|jgi:uncharacterized membrane protein
MSEISKENLSEIDKRYRTTVFIVLGQIFFVLLLIAAAWILNLRFQNELAEKDLTTLWVGVLFVAVGSFLLRRMFFNWERLKNIALLKGVAGLLRTLQRNSIILGTFAVVVALLGFVITAFSGNGTDIIRAGAIALVVFLINFPRRKVWRTIVSNLGKV